MSVVYLHEIGFNFVKVQKLILALIFGRIVQFKDSFCERRNCILILCFVSDLCKEKLSLTFIFVTLETVSLKVIQEISYLYRELYVWDAGCNSLLSDLKNY